MEKEKTVGQKLAEKILYEPKHIWDAVPEARKEAMDFCEDYKTFLNVAKTEREAVSEIERRACAAGYVPFEVGKMYEPGAKIYFNNREKSIICATLGQKSLEEGAHLMIAHIDSPRLDLKPNPLYEDSELALFKTHYYGGIRKYQWGATPLSLHGVVVKSNGEKVTVCIGEEEGDPVFCVTDLLPHLAAEQSKRTLGEGLKGEELNIVLGSLPYDEEDVKDRVKLQIMNLLYEKYGFTERDFTRAELEAVPAFKAVDVGLDRSLIGSYGHDDRVCAYTALQAELQVQNPAYTTVCVLTDKEEVGSDGVTGLQCDYLFHFLGHLADMQKANYKVMLAHSKCLSADVNAAFDPTFPDVLERRNAAYLNHGVAVTKYTGARGKSSTNDAGAEMMGYVTNLLDAKGVIWQTGELGKVDMGGGGTIAKYVANRNVDVVDIGVPMLSMHAPFELVAKLDVYMTYKAFEAFANER
ncbi:aminopeptidase [uncultured Ruthenibacterium sp.]|uniref:aminopeptidase n=1 Tax=uncultured Ruthenibacterium sp. TaxID=1905347 RepID=UPI00349EBF4B